MECRAVSIAISLLTLAATWPFDRPDWASAAETLRKPSFEDIDFFETKIRPVLVDHCYACHSGGAKKTEGGLRLDNRAGLFKGGTMAR